MSRTTIDGLTVRTSSSTGAVGSSRVVGGSLVDDFKPARRTTKMQTTRRQEVKDYGAEDFLAKNADADYNEKIVGARQAEKDESDWSDLLSQLDDSPTTKTSGARGRKTTEAPKKEDLITEEDEKPQRKKKSKAAKPKKKRHIARKILLVFLALIIAGGVWLYFWGDGLISRLTNGNSGLIGTIWSLMAEEVPFETDANGRTNVLVFGTEGYDMSGSSGNGKHDGAQLTDSIMVVSFDQKTKDVALLSLPRDLKVAKACYSGKVNEVFTCNNANGQNEEAGALALAEQVGQIFGITFQYWAHVNWGSLVEIVDALGGITVTLDEDINDYNYTKVVIKAGVPTRLNGEQAVGLSRARHGTQGGDFTRGNSQQKIVEGIIQELVSTGVDLPKVLSLVNILGDNFRSNFSSDNIKAGASLAAGFDVANIRNVPLVDYNTGVFYVKTGTINDISYVLPNASSERDYSKIQAYVAKMFSSNPAVREDAGIAVFNATGEAGLAGAEQEKLEGEGYTVYSIGDAAGEDCTEKYCLYALSASDKAPETQKALEAKYGVSARPGSELPGDIAAGYADFVVVIGQGEEE